MNSFYITTAKNFKAVKNLSRFMMSLGMNEVFQWYTHLSHQCDGSECEFRSKIDLAKMRLHASSSCDLFLGVSPLGKNEYLELGRAIGSSKKVVLISASKPDSIFCDLIDTVQPKDAESWIKEWNDSAERRVAELEKCGRDLINLFKHTIAGPKEVSELQRQRDIIERKWR